LIFLSFVTDASICLQTQGLYPNVDIDVEVSSIEDIVRGPKPDVPADQKKASIDDDAGDGGVSSVELITPNLISSGVPKESNPSAIVQVPIDVRPTGERGCMHPPPATRWNKPILQVDQVMTQVELSPYRGPRNPLDLVTIEIIFECIFEVFQHISQAAATGAAVTNDDRPQKRLRQPPLRKVLSPR
jgi:hypothetical protein